MRSNTWKIKQSIHYSLPLALTLGAQCASAQVAVVDAANLSENSVTSAQSLLVAARTLQSNLNEAKSIANQVTSLANEALNLKNLPYDIINQYTSRFQQLIGNVQNISGVVRNYYSAVSNFQSRYPTYFAYSNFDQQSINNYRYNWHYYTYQNLQDTVLQGSEILNDLMQQPYDTQSMASASQWAPGALQAIQAGNQIALRVAEEMGRLNTQNVMFQNIMLEKMALDESDYNIGIMQRRQVTYDQYTPYYPTVTAPDPRY